ncbi:hypothetical protein NP493_312g01007 [Ridgeia piscesae]|uniref:Guanylate cyclase domain-containing protein n=1 Tax=Ridgeia piscesae TaxID=27915 RepID=A0AAD9L4W0_RIDPI|nr:hypothetical protein NP493_312g01007 [Ridgeia piscesae]
MTMNTMFGSLSSMTSRISALSENEKPTCACQANPTTQTGRRLQLAQLLMLPMVNIIAVIVYTLVLTVNESRQLETSQVWTSSVRDGIDATYALRALQLERRVGVLWTLPNITSAAYPALADRNSVYEATDASLDNVTHWPGADKCGELLDLLPDHRLVSGRGGSDAATETTFYNGLARCIIDSLYEYVALHAIGSDLARYTCAFNALLELNDAADQLRLLGQSYYSKGVLSRAQHVSYIEYSAVITARFNETLDKVADLKERFSWRLRANDSLPLLADDVIRENIPTTPSVAAVVAWDRKCDNFSTVLDELTDAVGNVMSARSQDTHVAASALIIVLYALIIVAQLPIVTFLVNNALITMESIRNMVLIFASRTNDLKKEKRRAEVILSGMLPKAVAKDLRLGRAVHAQQYANATVFFSDIPDFVEISNKSEPMQIVTLLNNFYNFLDSKLEYYDVYKVETIGSIYMVVSGVPLRNGNRHVVEIATMALDILESTEDFVIPHLPGRQLVLRIGFHTGPCAAGVVGVKMPRYCLFGDSVNTASRMQSNGLAHKIHISEASHEELVKDGGFQMKLRGTLDIKGKGYMNTYWLLGRTPVAKPRVNVRIDTS